MLYSPVKEKTQMHKHTGILYIALMTICLTLIVSCGHNLIPKQVSVDISIDGDGTYEVSLDGRVLSGMYLLSESFGEVGIEDEWVDKYVVDDEIEDLQNDRKFRSAEYLGDGVYEVSFHDRGVFDGEGDPFEDFRYMELTQHDDGTVEFRCTLERYEEFEGLFRKGFEEDKDEMSDTEKEQAKKFFEILPDTYHKTFEGLDWRIYVDTDAEVIEHNAQSEPWFFGLFGGYEWHVTSPDDPQPYILIRLDTPDPVDRPGTADNYAGYE